MAGDYFWNITQTWQPDQLWLRVFILENIAEAQCSSSSIVRSDTLTFQYCWDLRSAIKQSRPPPHLRSILPKWNSHCVLHAWATISCLLHILCLFFSCSYFCVQRPFLCKESCLNFDQCAYLIFVISFTLADFRAWKFYTRKCVNSRKKLSLHKTA